MLVAILIILSLLVGAVGFATLTVATAGVGTLAAAVLLAVLARIAQAADHHTEVKNHLRARESSAIPAAAPEEHVN